MTSWRDNRDVTAGKWENPMKILRFGKFQILAPEYWLFRYSKAKFINLYICGKFIWLSKIEGHTGSTFSRICWNTLKNVHLQIKIYYYYYIVKFCKRTTFCSEKLLILIRFRNNKDVINSLERIPRCSYVQPKNNNNRVIKAKCNVTKTKLCKIFAKFNYFFFFWIGCSTYWELIPKLY